MREAGIPVFSYLHKVRCIIALRQLWCSPLAGVGGRMRCWRRCIGCTERRRACRLPEASARTVTPMIAESAHLPQRALHGPSCGRTRRPSLQGRTRGVSGQGTLWKVRARLCCVSATDAMWKADGSARRWTGRTLRSTAVPSIGAARRRRGLAGESRRGCVVVNAVRSTWVGRGA